MENYYNVAEIKLVYKPRYSAKDQPTIDSSNKAYQILKSHWDEGLMQFLEQFKIILLSTANKVLGIFEVSSGGINCVTVDQRIIFAAAIKANATQIILAHNHPSGNLKPSSADLMLTKNLVEAGKILNIKITDHLIVTANGYYSFADEGNL